MLGEGTTEIFITFLLAIMGYAGLTVTLLVSLKRKVPFQFWRIIVVIILIHVAMVWAYRYNWQYSLAVRNGYIGFLIFHSALCIILISLFVNEKATKILVQISFVLITTGAVGASFKYDVAEVYRVPVILIASAGTWGLFKKYFKMLL